MRKEWAAPVSVALHFWQRRHLLPLPSLAGILPAIPPPMSRSLSTAHKHDELHESGITLDRAERYWPSIFRTAWLSRVHDQVGGPGWAKACGRPPRSKGRGARGTSAPHSGCTLRCRIARLSSSCSRPLCVGQDQVDTRIHL